MEAHRGTVRHISHDSRKRLYDRRSHSTGSSRGSALRSIHDMVLPGKYIQVFQTCGRPAGRHTIYSIWLFRPHGHSTSDGRNHRYRRKEHTDRIGHTGCHDTAYCDKCGRIFYKGSTGELLRGIYGAWGHS